MKGKLKMPLYLISLIFAAIASAMTLKTINFKPLKFKVEPGKDWNPDIKKASGNLSKAVKIKTVSASNPEDTDWNEFKKFHRFLEKEYPLIHEKTQKEVINDYGLLYIWKGKDSTKKPVMLMAHQDVVPVEEKNLEEWHQPPFSGKIADGYLWGRGSLDIKLLLIAIMESVESFLQEGFVPERDIYLFFGHDEEVGGRLGAVKMAEIFKERGIEFEYIIDEGGVIAENILKEIKSPIALVGTCEKGHANIRLSVDDTGGHASMPPKNTALGVISKAVVKLEKHQMKPSISQPVSDFLKYVGPEMKGVKKVVLANLWLLAPLFKVLFVTNQLGNALLRTTCAPTMAQGSKEPNVLPSKASVVFNFRIAPGETGDDIVRHIKKIIKDPRVKIEVLRADNPSCVSGVDNPVFKTLEKTIYQTFPEAIVIPYLVMASTDSAKFQEVCPNIYRPGPYKLDVAELQSIHGINERVSLENIGNCICFYKQLIYNTK